jgi:lycopene beta-cyclase
MPHQAIDLWMDAVLLHVLRQFPQLAPDLFLRMAAALTGDEFATFLSGEAGWRLRLKVILAMPKWPFLKAGVRLVLANPGLSVRGRRAWT